MTREDAIHRLRVAQTLRDKEEAHSRADDTICDLLCELGYRDVVDEFMKLERWCA